MASDVLTATRDEVDVDYRSGASLARTEEFATIYLPDNVWPKSHPLCIWSTTLDIASVHSVALKNPVKLTSVYYTNSFFRGGIRWRMIFIPDGEETDSKHSSLYLERVSNLDEWEDTRSFCVQFALVTCGPEDLTKYHVRASHCRFTKRHPVQGFPRFSNLKTDSLEVLGSTLLFAFVRVLQDPMDELWTEYFGDASRRRTGYMGLRSDPRSPALGAVVRMLFGLAPIRKVLGKFDPKVSSVSTAVVEELQKIFRQLVDGQEPAVLSRLQDLLDIDHSDPICGGRVSLVYRSLTKHIAAALEGTREGLVIERLFSGKTRDHVRPDRRPQFDISTTTDFQDLQFLVSGESSLSDLFSRNTQIANADDCVTGRRNAFLGLPPVLRIQLDYRTFRDSEGKQAPSTLSDPPAVFDLAGWVDPATHQGLSREWVYHLHALVRFSDEVVMNDSPNIGRVCFLTYVRELVMDVITKPFDVAEETGLRFETDALGEPSGTGLYDTVVIASDESLSRYPGLGIDFETKDRSTGLKTTHIFKWERCEQLLQRLALCYRLPPQHIQLWFLSGTRLTQVTVPWGYDYRERLLAEGCHIPALNLPSEYLWFSPERRCMYIRFSPGGCKPLPNDTRLVFLKTFDLGRQIFRGLRGVEVDTFCVPAALRGMFIGDMNWAQDAQPTIYVVVEATKFVAIYKHGETVDLRRPRFVNGSIVCVVVDHGQPLTDDPGDCLWYVDREGKRIKITLE